MLHNVAPSCTHDPRSWCTVLHMSAQHGRLVITPNSNNRELIEKFRLGTQAVGVSYSVALEQGMRMWMEWAAKHWSGVPTPPPARFGIPVEEWPAGPDPFVDPIQVPYTGEEQGE